MEKSEQFGLVMTPQEKAALVQLAAKARVSAASVVRRLVWSEARARGIVFDEPESDLGLGFASRGGGLMIAGAQSGCGVNVTRIGGLRSVVQQQQRKYLQLREELCEVVEIMPMMWPEELPDRVDAITLGAVLKGQDRLNMLRKLLEGLREMFSAAPDGQRAAAGDAGSRRSRL